MDYKDKFPAGRPIKTLLPTFLKRIQRIKNDDVVRISEAWPNIVGEKFVPFTKIERLEKGTLFVLVSKPALLQILTQEKPRLLKELDVKNIVFRRY